MGDTPLLYSCLLYSLKIFKKVFVITKNKKILNLIPNKINKLSGLDDKRLKGINYFFSLMNEEIIPSRIYDSKKMQIINFHDGPLPKYAGLYSSTWAIINSEKNHGVTWHKVNDIIDGGDILLKKKFQISKNDTAESIDLKSNFNGFILFKDLIKKIISNNLEGEKQNFKKRTYFGLKDRYKIPNYGFINYNDSINKILRIARSLKMSPNKKNKLCKLKILTSMGVMEIQEINLLKNKNFKVYKPNQIIICNNKGFYLKIKNNILHFKLKNKKIIKKFKLFIPNQKFINQFKKKSI